LLGKRRATMHLARLCIATFIAVVAGSDKAGSHRRAVDWQKLRKQLEARTKGLKAAESVINHKVHAPVDASGRLAKKAVVVRKVRKQFTHISTFAGAQRTDSYSFHGGLNCSTGHGGHTMATLPAAKTLPECQQLCALDDDCTCISFVPSTGRCAKQRNCYTESCTPSSLVDTYVQHTTLKIGNGSAPQAQFERSGGRKCTAMHDVTNIGSEVEDLSVTQCLESCIANTACGCVRYERYFQSRCLMQQNCPKPTFCDRSSEYDTYVKLP
jgi:hypothetical protein